MYSKSFASLRHNDLELLSGWPDEFLKKVAQNVAQPIFVKINTLGKVHSLYNFCYLCHLKKYSKKLNNLPMGENWPNLVTLIAFVPFPRWSLLNKFVWNLFAEMDFYPTESEGGINDKKMIYCSNLWKKWRSVTIRTENCFFLFPSKKHFLVSGEKLSWFLAETAKHVCDYLAFKTTVYEKWEYTKQPNCQLPAVQSVLYVFSNVAKVQYLSSLQPMSYLNVSN
jgi:hypothetical protein